MRTNERKLRKVIREEVQTVLFEDRTDTVRSLVQLQNQYGDRKALQSFLEYFDVRGVQDAIERARRDLEGEREGYRNRRSDIGTR